MLQALPPLTANLQLRQPLLLKPRGSTHLSSEPLQPAGPQFWYGGSFVARQEQKGRLNTAPAGVEVALALQPAGALGACQDAGAKKARGRHRPTLASSHSADPSLLARSNQGCGRRGLAARKTVEQQRAVQHKSVQKGA